MRKFTSNFSFYQGLKGIPFGLLLLIVSFWANSLNRPASLLSMVFPLSVLIATALIYWFVTRFYDQTFGVVKQTPTQKLWVAIRSIIGGISALIAFWIDITYDFGFSMLGLIFAVAILADYLQFAKHPGNNLLVFYPVAVAILLILSLLPLIGIDWWQMAGFKALILATCVVSGLLICLLGVITHISFEYFLQAMKEENGG